MMIKNFLVFLLRDIVVFLDMVVLFFVGCDKFVCVFEMVDESENEIMLVV